MEHEDNTQFDNYLQNSQNRLETLQHLASSGAVDCGDVAEEIVAGAKFGGEHDHDEEEWKYIKEVQQSEKQQQHQQQQHEQQQQLFGEDLLSGVGSGVGEVLDAVVKGNGLGNGNGGEYLLDGSNGIANNAADADIDEQQQQQHHHHHVYEEEDAEVIKNDYDYSTNSNTTTSTGDVQLLDDALIGHEADASKIVFEVKNEQKNLDLAFEEEQQKHQQLLPHDDEEEPSSVATTYGTSSLSENATPLELEQQPIEQEAHQQQLELEQQQQHAEQNQLLYHEFNAFADDNKENTDPVGANAHIENRPTGFEIDQHSQLNPNAVEFVPHFGSQPTSPTTETQQNELLTNEPHPIAVPRHLLVEDDLVAESPRKGRAANMDTISLPAENEFEDEVAKRPHELEQEDDDLIGDGVQQQPQQHDYEQHLPHEQLENGIVANEAKLAADVDSLDYQRHSPASFIDHGPETSVDLESGDILHPNVDAGTAAIDPMKESIYVEHSTESNATNDAAIEDILNSVQPLPNEIDSLNNSFIEEEQIQNQEIEQTHVPAAGDKELLNVEEKEHISQSPSTEELQVNLPNELHSSIQGIEQLPIDLDKAAPNMTESFFLQHTSTEQMEYDQIEDDQLQHKTQDLLSNVADQSFLMNTSIPQEIEENTELLLDNQSQIAVEDNVTILPPQQLHLQPEIAAVVDITPSPISSTEEKHLVEDTKEDPLQQQNEISALEQNMGALLLSNDSVVGASSQEAEHADFLTATNDNNAATLDTNPFLTHAYEIEPQQTKLDADVPAQPNEISTFNEEQQPHQAVFEETVKSVSEVPIEAATQDNENNETNQAATSAADEFIEVEHKPVEQAVPEQIAATIAPEPPVANDSVTQSADATAAFTDEAAIAASAVAAVAATTAVAATVASAKSKDSSVPAAKKSAVKASSTSTVAKPKVGAPKKPIVGDLATKKSTASTTTAAARPRTAPTAAAAKPATTTATARKTLTSKPAAARPATAPTNATAKPATKTTTTSTTTAARVTGVPRKPLTNGTSTAAAKPRTIGATATNANKLSTTSAAAGTGTGGGAAAAAAAAKPKLSPRSTLTSQLRKTAPAPGAGAGLSGAKSPLKPITNGVGVRNTTTSTTASRTKTSTGTSSISATTTTTTTTTKSFTARPAPKTTHSTNVMPSSARRPASSGANTARRTSPQKPTSAGKTASTAAATKSSPLKTKAKEPISAKSSPIALKGRKPTPIKANGHAKEAVAAAEQQPIDKQQTAALNGNGTDLHLATGGIGADGDHHTEQLVEQSQAPLQQPPEVALLDF